MNTVRLGGCLIQRLVPLVNRVQNGVLPQQICRRFATKPQETENQARKDLVMTDPCVEHLKNLLKDGEFLRVFVEGGGCSGFSYRFELDTNREDDDISVIRDGAEVVTDADSFELIKGCKIDYETELIKASFRVMNNPQSSNCCSCGTSFSVDLE